MHEENVRPLNNGVVSGGAWVRDRKGTGQKNMLSGCPRLPGYPCPQQVEPAQPTEPERGLQP